MTMSDNEVTPRVNYSDWNINLAGQQGQQGATSIAEAPNDGQLYGRKSLAWALAASSGGPALPGYLSGLTLANDANPNNVTLDIAAGAACSDDNTTMMTLSVPLRRFSKRRGLTLTDGGLGVASFFWGGLVGGTSGAGIM